MADAQIHSVRKDMKEVEDRLSQSDKDSIEKAIIALQDAVKDGDKETVTQRISDLLASTDPIRKAKEAKSQEPQEVVTDAEVKEVKDPA